MAKTPQGLSAESATAKTAVEEAMRDLQTVLKGLEDGTAELSTRKAALGVEIAALTTTVEGQRREAEGQLKTVQGAYDRAREASIAEEQAVQQSAATLKGLEEAITAARKKADDMYAARLAEKATELAAIEDKILKAQQRFDTFKRTLG